MNRHSQHWKTRRLIDNAINIGAMNIFLADEEKMPIAMVSNCGDAIRSQLIEMKKMVVVKDECLPNKKLGATSRSGNSSELQTIRWKCLFIVEA